MADRTRIEWTDASWTPIRARHRETGRLGWHCEHVTEACRHCYAETFNRRLGTGLDFRRQDRDRVEIALDETMLLQPLHWRLPRRIFVCSMTDLFAEFATDAMIDRVFAVMAASKHLFQVLTKRPARMRDYIADPGTPERVWAAATELVDHPHHALSRQGAVWGGECPWPLRNVWLGTSIHDQASAESFVPILLRTPAAKRFVSCEPLLGPLDLRVYMPNPLWNGIESWQQPELDWVICGGESGADARPMQPDWARALRDQCARAGVPFFFKQWGSFGSDGLRVGKKGASRLLDGVLHDAMPAP